MAGDLTLQRVIIHAIEDDTFRAVLKLSRDVPSNEQEDSEEEDDIDVDARPSDAIALAVRTGSGIWMLEEVVAEASIAVDAEADARDQSDFNRFVDELSPAALVRHLRGRDPDPGSTEPTNDDDG